MRDIGVFSYWKRSILYRNFKLFFRFINLPLFYIVGLLYNFYKVWVKNKSIFGFFFSNSNLCEEDITITYNYYIQKKKWLFFNKGLFFNFIDLIYTLLISLPFMKSKNKFNYNIRANSRLNQVNWSFYNDLNNTKASNNWLNYYYVHYLSGIRYIWFGIRYWLFGLLIGITVFYFLTYIRLLPFNKIIFEWVLITMFSYWLFSGFVFFIKKYQFSKFTSVLQRFWKRTYILFWLIESGVFMVFFYLTLNASEEPVYMYDQAKLFKTHLFSWRVFLLKLLPIVSLILLGYYLLLSLKWTTFSKQVPTLVIMTLLLIYVFWLEFYQFFHIISYYGSLVWSYDSDEFLWNLDIDFKRTRIINNVTTVCLLAKFWHLVFIFIFWVFFILRVNEIGRVRYPLLAANLQNFIILYLMSWLYMYPWLKFAFKRHLETQYYWFFFNARRLGIRVFFNDLWLFFISLQKIIDFKNIIYFNTGSFYYWFESSSELGLLQYKKHIIRDYIISNLNSRFEFKYKGINFFL